MTRPLLFLLANLALAQLRVDFSTTAVAGSDNTLYAISGTNLFRTTDLGVNWIATHPTAAPGQAQHVVAVAANPLDPSIVYAGTDMDKGGVWKSVDSGVTWTRANSGLPATGSVEELFAVENQASTFYLKSGTAIYKTSNAAASWTLQSTLPAAGTVFTINARTPTLMYFVRPALGTSTIVTVFRSDTEGATWQIAGTVAVKPIGNDAFMPNSAAAIASSPANPSLVLLSTRGTWAGPQYSAVHRSTNRGATFTPSLSEGSNRIVVDTAGNVFAAHHESSQNGSRFQKSTTEGATWQQKIVVPGLQQAPVMSLDLRHPGHMFLGLNGVYRSTDAGETWARLSGSVRATLAAPTAAYSFQGSPGSRPTRNLAVQFLENAGWTAPFTATVEGAPWLTLSASSGTTPATLEVRVSTDGIAKGSYSGTIRVSSASATGDLVVPVTLNVTDVPVPPRSYRASTFAGGGTQSLIGAALTEARFSASWGVTRDPAGNFVISDSGLNQIFRVKNGVLEHIAGIGTRGSNGDGGLATAAQFASPTWVAFGNGETYVADTSNFRLRRINAQGVISSLNTNTRFSLGGMVVDESGNLYSAGGGEIRVRTPEGSDTRFSAGPTVPGQMVRDSKGNFYLTDSSLHQVVRISTSGVSTVIAGSGTAGFSGDGGPALNAQLNGPRGVAVDADGNVYIADTDNHRIRMVDASGAIFTIAGAGTAATTGFEGLAAEARFSSPYSLLLDANGDLYVGESIRVRKLSLVRPSIRPNGVANAASYTPDASPGSLVAIFGDDLANGIDAAKSAPWPTTLAGATVTLNGRPMPLYYVSPTQVNAMVPYETPLGPATLVVSVGGVASAAYTVNISQASPGIIGFGDNRAVAVNEDGSINTGTNPAKPGSTVVVYMIGIGVTDVPVATGAAAPLDRLVLPAGSSTVTLGSQTVTPAFLGLTPGSVALAQLNLKLDENLADGDYAVKVTIAGKESNAPVISVRR